MTSLRPILRWLFGLSLIGNGVHQAIVTSAFGGLLLIVTGILILPPTFSLIQKRTGQTFSRPLKVIVVVGLLVIGVSIVSSKDLQKDEEHKKAVQADFDKLPQATKDSILKDQARQDSLAKIQEVEQKAVDETNNRKELVEKQFSAWDGSHLKLTRMIKESMNDPDSYEHVETRFADKGDYILVMTRFRGKNAFGGKVVNSVTAKVDFSGNVIQIVNQNQ